MENTKRTITVGLIGNPNCGKSTLFNKLAKANANIGNYPRVTVDIQEAVFEYKGHTIQLLDLPGIYSLTSKSPEERLAREFLHSEKADVLINILDAGNMERSLFFTTQLLEMGQATVYALNMIDEAHKKGIRLATDQISSMLGGPVVETSARNGEGLEALMDAVIARPHHDEIQPVDITYDSHLESSVTNVQQLIAELHPDEMDSHQTRWLAIKLLEGDDEFLERQEADHTVLIEMVRRERFDLQRSHGDECETMFAYARYGFINGLLSETRTTVEDPAKRMEWTRQVDHFLLHQFLGLPLFLFLMWLMFETTFTMGNFPAGWIDSGVQWFSSGVSAILPAGLVHDLLVEGVIAGVGAVIVFLPYILILFFFLALFNETGYMARASFLLDRVMHIFGLHGKAFIPLVMGFGCNVPAVMATRTIESPRSRLITILINPFMSCSQRLPAFILLAGAFFTDRQGLVIFSMYIISIVVAMGASVFLSRFVIHGGKESFVMELPPYRLPTWESILFHIWEKAYDFVRMVGGVIVAGSIIIWFLQAFPQEIPFGTDYEGQIASLSSQQTTPETAETISQLKRQRHQERLEKSYLGVLGQSISPVFEPLGFDWKDAVAIVTGIFAKEVVVASYAVLYAQDEGSHGEGSDSLREEISHAMAPLTAFALMVFLLLYSPCLSTIAAIQRETKSWGWAGFSVVFSLSIAWVLAFGIVSLGGYVA
ncbi:MAG: ferrous iron transport protein B [Magnetococcales bacterium]|nr:ferrous iron transport protein B [Magnetococcales bacterium]